MSRYFRKFSPNVELWMSTGRHIKFPTSNGKFGYLASDDPQIKDDPAILAEIEKGIQNQVGGVQEISAEQYEEEWVKKKNSTTLSQGSKRLWRDEVSAPIMSDTITGLSARPAAQVKHDVPRETIDPVASGSSLRERARVGSR